jgi:hypothetical protein
VVEDEVYQQFMEGLPRHKTVAEAIREHMQSVVDEQKKAEGLESKVSILSLQVKGGYTKQITLDTYFPRWMQDRDNWQLQNEVQDSLSKEQKLEAYQVLKTTTKRWASRLHV